MDHEVDRGPAAGTSPSIQLLARRAGHRPATKPRPGRCSGNINWTDADRVHKLTTETIPEKVAADVAYQNAKNSDRQNARIEHDHALLRVVTALLKDDAELFKQFSDNPAFKKWLADTVFGITYS